MMYYIESDSHDPYENLAMEEYLFNTLPSGTSCLMLWQNRDSVIIGRYQNTVEEINVRYIWENNIPVVRRLSGGGAVYHDLGNLNYTIIEDQYQSKEMNMRVYIAPVIRTLKKFGIIAEFTGRNDITINGKKVSGNSQYVRGSRILHHGCILLDSDLSKITAALNVKGAKFVSKSVKSVTSRVTTINDCASEPIIMDQFRRELAKECLQQGMFKPYKWLKSDKEAINELQVKKYITWDWNYGFQANYSVRKQRKFEMGLITADMDVRNACIEKICLTGDFFGNGEISELQHHLEGLSLNKNLLPIIRQIDISHYIYGVTDEEFYDLLIY